MIVAVQTGDNTVYHGWNSEDMSYDSTGEVKGAVDEGAPVVSEEEEETA